VQASSLPPRRRRQARGLHYTMVVVVAIAALVYFRPLTVYFAVRKAYLFAIGARGHDVQVGPHRMHYLVAGDGPPLVLVHGVAMRAEDWAPVLRTFARSHRVYAPDLLGYGESDQGRDHSVGTQAEVVRGFLDAMHLQQPDMLGVSMGGWIALKVAAEHPQRVRKLVLVSSAGFEYKTSLSELSFSPRNIEELRASLAMQSDRARLLPTFVLRDFLRHSKMKAPVVRASMRAALSGRDLLNRKLHRVTMPVLLVWGTNDRIVPFHLAAEMQQELPHAKLVALEGCGHLAIMECRQAAIEAAAFLQR
jgi:abhydrolase domain-containing protein 6